MNIEIANRLIELRKKNGLSQEELASRLGLSRQAVSKWERAESSPDTDNLICLAKLYGVSLDELLNTDQSVEEIRTEVLEKEEERKQSETESGKRTASEEERKRSRSFSLAESISTGVLYLVALIVYLLVSSFHADQWGKLWVIFVFPPVVTSLISCIRVRRVTEFLYPVLAAFVFLAVGMYTGVWHPTWIVFLTIPVFYMICEPIDRAAAQRRSEPVDTDEDADEDEDEDDEKES